ncbi:hypothetical protein KUTeg_003241 [Tegillarca granosa]|uniref:Mre11 DNA-binding domain-containing protein n=1 Tax=Tegillarca granosa TaxID=220873 RepID=A0ABQ9FQZ8_TEGGR|nr:hypothetical protein KUTeg_003241 [Tegillarca granosa]
MPAFDYDHGNVEGLSAIKADLDTSRVEDMVKDYFSTADECWKLKLLTEKGMGEAVQEFVDKEEKEAITELVKHQVNKTQIDVSIAFGVDRGTVLSTYKYLKNRNADEDLIETEISRYKDERKKSKEEDQEIKEAMQLARERSQTESGGMGLDDESEGEGSDDMDISVSNTGRGRGRGRGSRGGRGASETGRGKGGRGSRGGRGGETSSRGRGRSKASVVTETNNNSMNKYINVSQKSRKPSGKTSYRDFSDSDNDVLEISDGESSASTSKSARKPAPRGGKRKDRDNAKNKLYNKN